MISKLTRYFADNPQWRSETNSSEFPSGPLQLPRFPAYLDARQKLTRERIFDYQLPGEVQLVPTPAYINATSPGRFEINNKWVPGAVVVFPHLVLNWSVKSSADVMPHHLDIVRFIKPTHYYVIIGTGRTGKRVISESYVQLYSSLGIHVEYSDTFEACSSFNVACQDNHKVVGFLLPEDAD